MSSMKNYISLLLVILLLISGSILASCEPDSDNDDDSPDLQGEVTPVPGAGDQNESDSDAPQIELSSTDPEFMFLELMGKLGYEENDVVIVNKEVGPADGRLMWNIGFEEGFGGLGYARINDGSDVVELLKFMVAPSDFAPEPVRPGIDLAERITEALGITDEEYQPGPGPGYTGVMEWRKFTEFGEYEVCYERFFLDIKPGTYELIAIMFQTGEIDPATEIEVTLEEATEAALEYSGDADLVLVASTLILLSEGPMPPMGDGIYWEIVFVDGPILYVSVGDGSIVPGMPDQR